MQRRLLLSSLATLPALMAFPQLAGAAQLEPKPIDRLYGEVLRQRIMHSEDRARRSAWPLVWPKQMSPQLIAKIKQTVLTAEGRLKVHKTCETVTGTKLRFLDYDPPQQLKDDWWHDTRKYLVNTALIDLQYAYAIRRYICYLGHFVPYLSDYSEAGFRQMEALKERGALSKDWMTQDNLFKLTCLLYREVGSERLVDAILV